MMGANVLAKDRAAAYNPNIEIELRTWTRPRRE
jgi:hypothetical protein